MITWSGGGARHRARLPQPPHRPALPGYLGQIHGGGGAEGRGPGPQEEGGTGPALVSPA